jgi:uncharacterized delta-60 repeat protein
MLLVLTAFGRAAPGDVDTSFNPNVTLPAGGNPIYTVMPDPTGTIYIGGGFSHVAGVNRRYFARLLANGALDTSFTLALDGPVRSSATLASGATVAAGEFHAAGPATRNGLLRILPNGTLDAGFNPNATGGSVNGLVIQPDEKITVCGLFTTVSGTGRNRAARLLPGGTLETGFNPNASENVRTTVLQPDGKLVLAGVFTSVGGTPRSRIARILADGTLDTEFDPTADNEVYCLALQSDGKLLAGGSFTAIGGAPRTRLARIHANGSPDDSLNVPVNGIVRWVISQTDGKILLGGEFTSVGGFTRNRIARLLANGNVDTTFNPNANAWLFSAAMSADGRIFIGGNFTSVGGVTRNSVARLLNDPATESLTVPLLSRVQWLRGGAGPEVNIVSFELSTDGGSNWTALGGGTRISGGWERTGLSLPANGLVRARARVSGGYGNGSSGIIESIAAYSFSTLQLWRQTHFNTAENSGNAANNADPDKDGLENLVEFAFGKNPHEPDASTLPEWRRDDDDYVMDFTRPADASGITYVAEYSISMDAASWTPAVNVATPPAYSFYAPAVSERLYLRVRVTAP